MGSSFVLCWKVDCLPHSLCGQENSEGGQPARQFHQQFWRWSLHKPRSLLLAGAGTGIISVAKKLLVTFSETKLLWWQTRVCHNKTCLLLQQKYACCDKTFVVTNLYLSWQNIFVATNTCLSWQNFHHDKHIFVVIKDVFCHNKQVFVITKVSLSWQQFCRDIIVCHNKYLLQQK